MTAVTAATPRRLYRSTRDKKIAGVCGGIAEAMGWDVNAVRLIAALSILLPGPQVFAYLIAWAVLPTDREVFGWDVQHQTPTPPHHGDAYAAPAADMPSTAPDDDARDDR